MLKRGKKFTWYCFSENKVHFYPSILVKTKNYPPQGRCLALDTHHYHIHNQRIVFLRALIGSLKSEYHSLINDREKQNGVALSKRHVYKLFWSIKRHEVTLTIYWSWLFAWLLSEHKKYFCLFNSFECKVKVSHVDLVFGLSLAHLAICARQLGSGWNKNFFLKKACFSLIR